MGFEDGLKKGEKRTSVPSIKQGGESESDRKGFFEKVVGKINDLSGMPSKEVMAEWDHGDLRGVDVMMLWCERRGRGERKAVGGDNVDWVCLMNGGG